jgi:hypothetical protein
VAYSLGAPSPTPKKTDYYSAFIFDNCAIKNKNHFSLYDVIVTCFGFYMAIPRQVSKRDLETSLRISMSRPKRVGDTS